MVNTLLLTSGTFQEDDGIKAEFEENLNNDLSAFIVFYLFEKRVDEADFHVRCINIFGLDLCSKNDLMYDDKGNLIRDKENGKPILKERKVLPSTIIKYIAFHGYKVSFKEKGACKFHYCNRVHYSIKSLSPMPSPRRFVSVASDDKKKKS